MRKPNTHPEYGINLKGINFSTRWNVLQKAQKGELLEFTANFHEIKKFLHKRNAREISWWEYKKQTAELRMKNTYFRKLWRSRHASTFKEGVLYRMDKSIGRWGTKLGPRQGCGTIGLWSLDKEREYTLDKNDLIVLTQVDELGNLYFSKIDQIDATYPFVFGMFDQNLAFVVPVES